MAEDPNKSTQADKFIDTARKLRCAEDEESFERKLKRLAKAKKAEPKKPPDK